MTRLHLALMLLLAAATPAAAQQVRSPGPLFSDPIPATAGLPFDPVTDTRESFIAPNGRRMDVLVQGPRGSGSYSRPIRADETADAYFPAVVREAVAAQAHDLRIPHGTYVFRGPAYCRDLASAVCRAATACTVNQYSYYAEAYILAHAAELKIAQLLDHSSLTPLYGDPISNSRVPDFIAVTNHGVICTGGSKLAEHGGFSDDDRNVALLLSSPRLNREYVETLTYTTQIAPTILHALGLDPAKLEAVRSEGTQVLGH